VVQQSIFEQVQRTHKHPTQRDKVLRCLRARGRHGVTNPEFIDIGILRAASRIDELRKRGYNIDTVKVSRGVYKYVLWPEQEYGNEN
jgi:hypothetical protein